MAARNKLPEQLTSFIGRERELLEVEGLLHATRLLTLTGAGGCGKTRLALELAARVEESYPDGIWLVELAGLTDPTLLPHSIVSVLGLREETGSSLETLLSNYLRPLNLLIILDNCEHLVDACASLVAKLLRTTPHLSILATSRQALGVSGEVEWRVPSLTRPDPTEPEPVASVARYEAVRLFVDRARLKRPDFALTEENTPAICQLCFHLDGIPLAIELAAARVKVLSVEQIVARLDERFRLLTGGSQTLMPRQQTLKAAIDWGYDLLPQAEQALLRSLSVFAGGFTLGAVEAICGGMVDEYEIINLLSHLVDKSLVIAEERTGEVRYRLLETIRQYAWEKLQESREAGALRVRHRDWCIRLAQESQAALLSDAQPLWLVRMEEEHDNLRAALAYCRESTQDTEAGLLLASAVAWFWYFRGFISEARGWLEGVLARRDARQFPATYVKACGAAGVVAYLQSDYAWARRRLEESAALAAELNDRSSRAFALAFLGRTAFYQGDPSALQYAQESVSILQELGHKWGLALALDFLGYILAGSGDLQRVESLYKESLELFKELGNKWGVALELSNFGRFAMQRGDLTTARAHFREAIKIQREVGDKWLLGWLLKSLGDVAQCQGDSDQAVGCYSESLSLFRKIGDATGTADCAHVLGLMRLRAHEYEPARKLLDESLDLYQRLEDVPKRALVLVALAATAGRQGCAEEARALSAQSAVLALRIGDPGGLVHYLSLLASVAVDLGRMEHAALLLGAVSQVRKSSATLFTLAEQEVGSQLADEIRGALGEAAFSAWWSSGERLADRGPRLIVEAVADLDRPPDAEPYTEQSPSSRRSHGSDVELTDRELEVLRLVAEGYTDGQLAERLCISIRTVQAHLRSIYSKMDVATRTGATRYALDHRLV